MRNISSLVFISLVSIWALAEGSLAESRFITGRGSDMRVCQESIICPSSVRQGAQRAAVDDANFLCRIQNGTPDSFSSYCNDYCHPSYIPTGEAVLVSCRSECQIRCVLPAPQSNEGFE